MAKVSISPLSNQNNPIILFVWEVTCQPALHALNAISKRYPQWQEESGLRVVAVSVDDSRSVSRVKPLSAGKGWTFDIYLDPNQAFKRAMHVPLCPYIFVLNGSGQIVWQKGGYTPGDEDVLYEIVQKIKQALPVGENREQ